jgi:hypothetical protein
LDLFRCGMFFIQILRLSPLSQHTMSNSSVIVFERAARNIG